ncbi:hypothetical protein ACFQZE_11635 [Paenibacillus sp. GCM10027627]
MLNEKENEVLPEEEFPTTWEDERTDEERFRDEMLRKLFKGGA